MDLHLISPHETGHQELMAFLLEEIKQNNETYVLFLGVNDTRQPCQTTQNWA